MKIRYVTGDATYPLGTHDLIGLPVANPESPDLHFIAHVCNNKGGWGAGFVTAISKRWSEPELVYRNSSPSLGNTTLVPVTSNIYVANMVAQEGYVTKENPRAIRYNMLVFCLDALIADIQHLDKNHNFNLLDFNLLVHMPRIGCGLAGGSWDVVEPIVEDAFSDSGINVVVYDLP